jgi:hypothetical protein
VTDAARQDRKPRSALRIVPPQTDAETLALMPVYELIRQIAQRLDVEDAARESRGEGERRT